MAEIIFDIKQLKEKISTHKSKQQTVVFTNGCFDILHAGHVDYLQKAKLLGDILIVAVNSDKSVKRLKGKHRPVNNEKDRLFILSSIKYIDYLTLFSNDTPYNLITELLPDILVKGGDWNVKNIVGGDIVRKHGGKVLTIPFLKGYSTSLIIEKIKNM